MPLDDGYQPSVSSGQGVIRHAPRVMRLSDLDEKERTRIQRAIDNLPPEEVPEMASGIVKSAHDYYCENNGALHDFVESAQRSADITNHVQTIHRHAHGEECTDREHLLVQPDPVRGKAVGGPQHG